MEPDATIYDVVVPASNVAGNMYSREDAIRALRCIDPPMGCGRQIRPEEFKLWGIMTVQEYRQSGWCQDCQNRVFLDPKRDSTCTCDDPPCCEVDVGIGIITCGDQHRRVCPTHELFDESKYDPDQYEDPPPHDMYEIEWSQSYASN